GSHLFYRFRFIRVAKKNGRHFILHWNFPYLPALRRNSYKICNVRHSRPSSFSRERCPLLQVRGHDDSSISFSAWSRTHAGKDFLVFQKLGYFVRQNSALYWVFTAHANV